MASSRQLAASLLILCTACAVELPGARELTFACYTQDDCSSGMVCVEQRCVLASAAGDAAPLTGDGGFVDAAGTDGWQPDATAADAARPDSALPDSALPDSASPDAAGTDASWSDVSRPDNLRPDTQLPDTLRPDTLLPDTSRPDSSQPDAGLPNHYALDWQAPAPLTDTIDQTRCETDPVLTPDERWLILTRPQDSGAGCYESRRFHVFEWNDGAPVYRSMLPKFDSSADENNPHPVAGAVAGRPGEILFVHTVYATTPELWGVWLQGDPPITPAGDSFQLGSINGGGDASSPTLSFAGDHIVFARDNDLYEATGAAPDSYGAATHLSGLASDESDTDPALSSDGRVLVFVRGAAGGGDDYDLWVARRAEPALAFEAPVLLPRGSDEINTDSAEMDPFISASGDLLYMSARGDGSTRRIYVSRGFVQ